MANLPAALATFTHGFRVVGDVAGPRRFVDAPAAATGYAALDPKAQCDQESFLSLYWFGPGLGALLRNTGGSVRDLQLPCWSPWLTFDLDGPELIVVLDDARRLTAFLSDRYPEVADADLVVFFSGRKGFHVQLPLLHAPPASHDFSAVCRRLAITLAEECQVHVDDGIYQPARLFRAANSYHPAGRAHKRLLDHDELMYLSADRLRTLAVEPRAYDFRLPSFGRCPRLEADWDAAATGAAAARLARPREPRLHLQRATLDFIREGAPTGERAVRLFRAAGNLREFGASDALIRGLLREAALDTGLSAVEVDRQIACGIDDVGKRGAVA